MKADLWKTLFKERGWWQGGEILAPQGQSLTVNFGHNTGVHFNVPADAGTPRQVMKGDEDFLIVVQEWSDGPRERRYLWEDVSGVECITRKPG